MTEDKPWHTAEEVKNPATISKKYSEKQIIAVKACFQSLPNTYT